MAISKTLQNHETDNHSLYMDEWQEYFLGIAKAVAKKSKDPRCSVGAVVVSRDRLVLSTGFNGLARGIYDRPSLLHDIDEKLKWICHAEANATLNGGRKGVSLENGQIIVTKFPCLFCCNLIVQSDITTICTDDEKFWDDDAFDRSPHTRKKALLREARIYVVAPPNHPFFGSLSASDSRRNQRRKLEQR
jgi:dCMP deaminase